MTSESLSDNRSRLVYLDNAATGFPKPPAVAAAMVDFLTNVGVSPGRSGHRLSLAAARIIHQTREGLARLFNASQPLRVVFTSGATESLNLIIHGLLAPGDGVITSSMEHNSVMRPLRLKEREGLEVNIIPCSPEGLLDPNDVRKKINKKTRMVILTHASNVTGGTMPVREVGEICRSAGIIFAVDAAQSAGCIPIDMARDGIDLLAFTGHKGLLGPPGTGGLVFGEGVDISRFYPWKQGGTGSRSEEEIHPDFLPDRFEAGTPNTVGLAGLDAGVKIIRNTGVAAIEERLARHTARLREKLAALPGLVLYGPRASFSRVGIVSFNICGLTSSEVGHLLDEKWGILCRVGLHCAPAAHRTLGSFPAGTVRLALGYFTDDEEIDYTVAALENIAREGGLG